MVNNDYTKYNLRSDGTYQEKFDLPHDHTDELTFQIVVRSEVSGVTAVYESVDFARHDAARIALIVVLVLLPILIVVVVGTTISVIIYKKLRKKRQLYNVVY
jgi:hypothetical protein